MGLAVELIERCAASRVIGCGVDLIVGMTHPCVAGVEVTSPVGRGQPHAVVEVLGFGFHDGRARGIARGDGVLGNIKNALNSAHAGA